MKPIAAADAGHTTDDGAGPGFRIEEASIREIQAAIKARRISSRELVEFYLQRIADYDRKGPALQAILHVNQAALALADRQDAAFASSGELCGPLHGIAIAVKDNFNTTDMPTTGGSVSLRAVVPEYESTVTRKLRDAGAIILAKTNMHEFALAGLTVSSLGGQTKNPYDLTRTPGGSSGGTGAAVAANFATTGMGTDTVNSVRSPASANCLVGLRPTKGLVSRAGVIPVSATQDAAGPITRSVADAAAMLDVLAGADSADPSAAPGEARQVQTYADYLDPDGLRGARIGILKSFMGVQPQHREVNHAIACAITAMRAAGAVLIELDTPLDSAAILDTCDTQEWEFKAVFNAYLETLPAGVTVRNLDRIIAGGDYHKPSLHEFLVAANGAEHVAQNGQYLKRLALGQQLREQVLAVMTQAQLDVIIYPLQQCLVVPIGEPSQSERNGILAAVTGFPALTLPAGFSTPSATASLGIPIGMDILARPFGEATLIKIGYAFEQLTRLRRAPPLDRWLETSAAS